jgi:homoserine kinase
MAPAYRGAPRQVRVPATCANLGPGYDALGLALAWHDEVVARVTDSGLRVDVAGEGGDLARGETHLVVRAMRAAFDRLGGQPHGLELSCTNRIPHGRGLGSSAAAIVAGVLLARALVVGGGEQLPDAAAFALAAELEGHPDNVAACFHGGLTVAWTENGQARAVRAPTPQLVLPVVLVPPFRSETTAARSLLPATVPHSDAAFAAGRSALLVAVLAGGAVDASDLLAATEDRLHQPYRAESMPATAELVDRLRGEGLAAVVSGAGPTVLVLARDDVEVQRVRSATPAGWHCSAVRLDDEGARTAPVPRVP